ncbi:MAG: LysR family transcriptional regulator [Planctomycetes bacterium]|nr:LysR family transcriptional regulator [Planctomycetota bacterium]
MQRVRDLSQFWNWLPAFRAVAETQHLPSAARQLHVTAPALSRSIKLLERHLGHKLFRRAGRNIVLTDGGQRLLEALRDAMRRVDEGVHELRDTALRGEVRILSSGLITVYLVRALRDLRTHHPQLRPVIVSENPDTAPQRLLRGEIDLALHSVAMEASRLRTEHLGQATSGVYCGPGHPLRNRRRITREQLVEHEFVGPTSGPVTVDDGWPPELPRKLAVRVSHMQLGCEVCAQGSLLATLPDVVAQSFHGGILHRLPIDIITPTRLFATLRPSLGAPSRADVVLAAVRREVTGVAAESSRADSRQRGGEQ